MVGAQATARSPQCNRSSSHLSIAGLSPARSFRESHLPLSPNKLIQMAHHLGHGHAHVAIDGEDDALRMGPASSDSGQGFLKLRPVVARFYNSFRVQMFVACLIGANFVTNMIEKEIDPRRNRYVDEFTILEYIYNILFTLELLMNMYSNQSHVFWRSGWNIFDVVVVSIGIVSMVNLDLPPSFSMLRMMRAFRVFRLFKRVRSLNKIIKALAHAVPGVVNAFVLLTIVMCIYAILAVEFFIDVGQDCHEVDATTAPSLRGHCFGEEYFGRFSKSLYSFFQVLTGESWSEAIARPVLWWQTNPWLAAGSALFFVSFVLVTAFVLTNVVVAVLLDKMVEASTDDILPGDSQQLSPIKLSPRRDRLAAEMEVLGGHMVSMESEIRQLAKTSLDMRADLDGTKQEMREQMATLIALVKDLGRQGNDYNRL